MKSFFIRSFWFGLGVFSLGLSRADDFTIPYLCLDRAQEQSILLGVPQNLVKTTLGDATRAKTYDYAKLRSNFQNTLNDLNEDLRNKGELFHFLSDCSANPALCVGHFNPKNEFHTRLFCDKEMLRVAIEGTLTYQNTWIARCALAPEGFYRSPLENDPEYLRDCFQSRSDENGQIHRTPVAEKYNTEQTWLKTWTGKFYDEVETAIRNSPYPDGMAYILAKISEEFGLRGSPQKEAFNQQLRYAAFIRALTAPSARHEAYQGKFLVADQYVDTIAQTLIQQDGRLGLVFQPQRAATVRAIQEFRGMRQTIEDPRNAVRPLEAAPRNLTYADLQSPKTPPTPNQNRKILKDFLPYQFMRVIKAKTIRTLQQGTKARFDYLMNDADPAGKAIEPVLYGWIDSQVACLGNTSRMCAGDLRAFRWRYYKRWHEQIKSGAIELDFYPSESETSSRQFIYDAPFVGELNRRLSAINRFCWQNAIAPADYSDATKRAQILEQYAPVLESMIEQLFQTPRYSELLENPFFNRIVRYRAGDAKYEACFSEGYIFGPEPKKTQAFHSQVQHYAPYPGVRVDNSVGMETVIRPYEKYQEPTIALSKQQIERVEADLESLMSAELNKIYAADRFTQDDDIDDFLEASATERIFALMEYGVDYPSQTIGTLIRSMLEKSNHDDLAWQATQRNLMIFIVAATIATAFIVPASMVVVYKLGAAFVSFTAGAALGFVSEFKYQKDMNALGRAAVSDNLMPQDAFELQGVLLEKIESNRIMTAFFAALSIATDLVIVVRGIQTMKVFLNRELRATYFKRMVELDKLQRTLTEVDEVTGQTVPARWMTYELKSYLANASKISKQLYDDFLASAGRGEGRDFLLRTSSIAERFPTLAGSSPSLLSRLLKPLTWTVGQISRPFAAGLDYLFTNVRAFQKIKAWWLQNLYRLARRDFLNQKKFVDTVNYALEKGHLRLQDLERRLSGMPGYEIRNGRLFWAISEIRLREADAFLDGLLKQLLDGLLSSRRIAVNELDEIRSFLPQFAIHEGRVSWTFGESNLAELLKTRLFQNHGLVGIVEYLNPVVKGNILDDAQWIRLFQNLRTPLSSVSDCKNLLKSVKFIAQEYGFREQIRRLANGNSISYQRISDFLLDNIDDVIATSRYVQQKNMVRFAEYVQEFSTMNPAYGLPEIDQAIRNVSTYDLNGILRDLPQLRAARDAFKLSTKASPDGIRMSVLQGELIKQESDIAEVFYNRLGKELRKIGGAKDFAYAYDRALFRAQQRKILELECSLPNSTIRTAPDRLFKSFAKYVSATTNVYGYLLNHPVSQEGLDMEYLSRLGYEILVPILSQALKTEGFIRAKTISSKAVTEWGTSVGVGATVMPMYQMFDYLFWDSPDLYTAKIREMIYQADDPQAKLNELFKRHPDKQREMNAKIEKLKRVWTDHFATLTDDDLSSDAKQAEFADGLYQAFLRNELIDDFKTDLDKVEGNQLVHDTLEEVFYYNAFENKKSAIRWGLFGYDIAEVHPPALPKSMEIRSRDWLLVPDFMSESFDRFAFYAGFDLVVDAPMTIVRQQAIRKTLCGLRHFPPVVGVGAAALMYAGYKIVYDPFRYWARNQITGH